MAAMTPVYYPENEIIRKIYERSEDLHTRSVVLYVNMDDNYKLYADPNYSEGITTEVLRDLFLKDMIIVCFEPFSMFAKPLSYREDNGVGMIFVDDLTAVAIEFDASSIPS